jgi:acyl-CoA synthetase (AMP-forming)/AMP-acid ligase II
MTSSGDDMATTPAPSIEPAGSAEAAGESLPAMLERLVAGTPDALAAIEAGADDTRRLSFAGLRAAADGLAARLYEAGLRAGDCIGIWLPNWLDALIWEFAAARLDCAVLGINTRYNVHELAHLISVARPRCIAHPDEFLGIDFSGRLRESLRAAGAASDAPPDDAQAVPPPMVAVVCQDRDVTDVGAFDVGGGARAWPTAPGYAGAVTGPLAASPAATANYFTTSGSTGNPKLAGHDQASVTRHARNAAAALEIAAADVTLCVLPLFGVFGFNAAMATLSAGGTCLLVPVFDADSTIDNMITCGVTHTVGGDDLHGRIMDAWLTRPRPLPSWRQAAIADFGGRAGDVAEWAQREFGVPVRGVYGSSEVFALIALRPKEPPVGERVRAGGRVVGAGIEVRACEVGTDTVCAPGQQGELQFRGYNVTPGYLRAPQADQTSFTEDGWFRSGDLGSTGDVPGEFSYVCRIGDALRLHGFLVEPAEIENFIVGHPTVGTVKVVGVTKADGTGGAVAFVTPADGAGRLPEAGELLAFCRSGLAGYKVPDQVRVLDSLPTTTGTNGSKIKTATLRQWAQESPQHPA